MPSLSRRRQQSKSVGCSRVPIPIRHCPCSAELHSAVSRIFNPQGTARSGSIANSDALPNAIRRHVRVQLCATAAATNVERFRGSLRAKRTSRFSVNRTAKTSALASLSSRRRREERAGERSSVLWSAPLSGSLPTRSSWGERVPIGRSGSWGGWFPTAREHFQRRGSAPDFQADFQALFSPSSSV